MKHILLLFILLNVAKMNPVIGQTNHSFHDFTATTIDGEQLDLGTFRGKKLMIVNTASKCGLTPQYEVLQKLYDQYKDDDFEVIGFPANNFLKQEPGSDEEIVAFCKKNYGVSFTMMSKIDVKGKNIHPIYQWLTQKEGNGMEDAKVTWNFQKFLIDEEGKYIRMISPKGAADDDSVIDWITGK